MLNPGKCNELDPNLFQYKLFFLWVHKSKIALFDTASLKIKLKIPKFNVAISSINHINHCQGIDRTRNCHLGYIYCVYHNHLNACFWLVKMEKQTGGVPGKRSFGLCLCCCSHAE